METEIKKLEDKYDTLVKKLGQPETKDIVRAIQEAHYNVYLTEKLRLEKIELKKKRSDFQLSWKNFIGKKKPTVKLFKKFLNNVCMLSIKEIDKIKERREWLKESS